MTGIIGGNLPHIPWQERPDDCREVIWRYRANPIVSPDAIPGTHTISNSAVVRFGDGFAGVFRCDSRTGYSELHAGFSTDGIRWQIEPDKIRFRFSSSEILDSETNYDPRICELDGKFYITWCSDFRGPTVSMAVTEDFRSFTKMENALLPANRNGVLFPRKVNGMYLLLSRPSDWGHTPTGDIFLSQSPDLEFWGRHRHVMQPTAGWQNMKIGAGPVPIETDSGWLIFYHGVVRTCSGFVYSVGAALLDIDAPWRVIARGAPYLMTPEMPYELTGYVPNVVFPVAALSDAKTGRIAIYYGCADTHVGLCFCRANEIVEWINGNKMP